MTEPLEVSQRELIEAITRVSGVMDAVRGIEAQIAQINDRLTDMREGFVSRREHEETKGQVNALFSRCREIEANVNVRDEACRERMDGIKADMTLMKTTQAAEGGGRRITERILFSMLALVTGLAGKFLG